jgi:hypothetical protein
MIYMNYYSNLASHSVSIWIHVDCSLSAGQKFVRNAGISVWFVCMLMCDKL